MGITKALKKDAKYDPPPGANGTLRPVTGEKDLPPGYDSGEENVAMDITSAFATLNLERKEVKPTTDECIAHLKLLEAINTLREDVGNTDGLYGLFDRFATDIPDERKRNTLLPKIREKRWAIYVQMAARRFEAWFETIERGTSKATLMLLESANYEQVHTLSRPLHFTPDSLPPLDVLMVWHTFLLNPRKFLSDCIRHNKIGLWRTGMPWGAVAASIDNNSFDYNPGERAKEGFTKATKLPWNNLESPPGVSLNCPSCRTKLTAPLTTATQESDWNIPEGRQDAQKPGETGIGFADAGFELRCTCGLTVTHNLLRVQRFRRDLQALFVHHTPMPGTLLSMDGLTPPAVSKGVSHDSGTNSTFRMTYPNRLLLSGAGAKIADSTELNLEGGKHWVNYSFVNTVSDIRKEIEEALKDKNIVRKASVTGESNMVYKEERIAIRRMMGCYWDDASIFSLDLAGAVIRQNAFVTKMHDIDWLHSPALRNTMQRLIEKYDCFFKIMRAYPKNVAVPTLDVDLAWHTHQLSPVSYRDYSIAMTKIYIDHDDKIDENKLSNSFEWTSKTYEKMFEKVYSECTCWYCESIREGHTSRMSRLFKGGKGDPVSNDLDRLHSAEPSNPHKSPHISAHNSVKPQTSFSAHQTQALDYMHNRQMERNYQKACNRAKKEGRRPPERDAYMYYPYWGMYYPMPLYVPYMGDPCVTGGMYAANPGCANFAYGAAGNCCAGTCGGAVASGACAGGACGGGSAGGACAGGGGGGCGGGGGGGGGCGGGGGGCGGGGGG